MIKIIKPCKHFALSLLLAGGMTCFAIPAFAGQTGIRSAQRQLRNEGYYSGTIDGIDGPMTHQAIRAFQRANNLAVNGRLDRQTCNDLGVQNRGEANRSYTNTTAANANGNWYQGSHGVSMSMVRSAQRHLRNQGLYNGTIDGIDGPMTHAAVRQFQQNNGLTASGRLNHRTLNKLGVTQS